MNFYYNTSYSSLELAKNIAINKSAVLIYCYWSDNDQYQRYPHHDSFVFYNFDNIQNFVKYLVWYIKKIIKIEKYEFEDILSTDNFNITIDGIFDVRCFNLPEDLVIDSDTTINLFDTEFKNFFELKIIKQITNKNFYIIDENFQIIQKKQYENCERDNNYLFIVIKEFKKIIMNKYVIERTYITEFYNDDSQKIRCAENFHLVELSKNSNKKCLFIKKTLGLFKSEKDIVEKLKNVIKNTPECSDCYKSKIEQ
jgi:hypothetical protein